MGTPTYVAEELALPSNDAVEFKTSSKEITLSGVIKSGNDEQQKVRLNLRGKDSPYYAPLKHAVVAGWGAVDLDNGQEVGDPSSINSLINSKCVLKRHGNLKYKIISFRSCLKRPLSITETEAQKMAKTKEIGFWSQSACYDTTNKALQSLDLNMYDATQWSIALAQEHILARCAFISNNYQTMEKPRFPGLHYRTFNKRVYSFSSI